MKDPYGNSNLTVTIRTFYHNLVIVLSSPNSIAKRIIVIKLNVCETRALSSRQLAYRKLQYWIDYYPHLTEQLEKMGSGFSCRTYMPAQVQLIVGAIGEP